MKALIIDDNEDTRSIAAMSLSMLGGMTVIEAANGEDGIALAKRDAPDFLLLDLVMPLMDGRETFQKLQADPLTKDIPVIIMAPAAMTSEIEMLKKGGVIGVITKPFDPTQLPIQVMDALKGPRG